jgi:DNA-binding transcriptional LysR family regulator
MNINSIDLNLMIAFDALITLRHVTKAGEAIGRSQPAMSNALARLRTVFHDQLLIKSGNHMKPTPRALELLPQIQLALKHLENAINSNIIFNPLDTKRNFTIAMVENAALTLLPVLTPYLFKNAPNIKIDVIGVNNIKGTELIETERCDMAIDLTPKTASRPLKKVRLYKEKFVCMTRPDHPILSLKPTLENYLTFKHIAVHPNEGSESSVDNALKSISKSRHIAIKSPYSLIVNLMLNDSDLVATLPEKNAIIFSNKQNLSTFDVPFRIPTFNINMLWHSRLNGDPAHKWLRMVVQEIAENVELK